MPKPLPSDYYYGVESHDDATGSTSYQSAQAAGVPLPKQYQDDHPNYNPPPPAPPPTGGSAPPPASPKWIWAANMPSTYPDLAAMKSTGTGLIIDVNDPNRDILIASCQQWGVPYAIAVGTEKGESPAQFAADVSKAKALSPALIVLDVEAAGKGYGPTDSNPAGSEGWRFSQQSAPLVDQIVGDTPIAVTMEPNQDDYNYGAYTGIDAKIWVQTYDGNMNPVGTPDQVVGRVVANGVPLEDIVPILGPTQKPPSDGNYVSFGIPLTGAAAAGVYAPNAPPTSNTPYYPGQQPVAGAGSGATGGGPPIYVNPAGQYGGGVNTPPTGTPPNPPPTDTGTGNKGAKAGDWATAYFGNLGLPADVQAAVTAIFAKYPDDPQLAVELARQYIHTTSWFNQQFPGFFQGIKTGLFADESGYRSYVNQANVYTMQYFNRPITTTEIESALAQGITPEILGRTYEAGAIARAQGSDVLYQLGAFGDMPVPDDARGQVVSDFSRAQAGLGSIAGAKVASAFDRANKRMQALFQGQLGIPNTAGNALAPTKPDLPA
jgi:hypothetical protein